MIEHIELKPTAVTRPSPGIWWVEVTSCQFRPSTVPIDVPSNSAYDWALTPIRKWIIVQVLDGYDLTLGTDELLFWDSHLEVITRIGPRILPPEEPL